MPTQSIKDSKAEKKAKVRSKIPEILPCTARRACGRRSLLTVKNTVDGSKYSVRAPILNMEMDVKRTLAPEFRAAYNAQLETGS